MKIVRYIGIALAGSIAILIVIGFIWKDELIQAMLPEAEKVKVTRITISNNSAAIHMELILHNQKYISYHLQSLHLDVYNDTLSLLHYDRDSVLILKRNERKMIPFECVLSLKKIIRRVKNLQGSDSTEIKITGWAVFSTPFGDHTIRINEHQLVEVPRLITVQLEEIQYDGKRGDKYLLEVKIKVNNPNDKKVEIKNVSYDFYGEDLFELHGNYHDNISVKPMGSVLLSFPLKVKIENKFKLISKMIFNKDIIHYRFGMKGEIESMGGIDQEILVKISTHGKVELLDKNRKNEIKFTWKKNPKHK